jgi:argininosuccinate synthase
MYRKIVLAYSGGLDTSIIVPWLRETYPGVSVICVAADIGQGEGELAGVREKAIASGADECYVEDLRAEFVTEYIWPTLRAGAVYGRKYLLGTSMARPLIARRQVELARALGADALAHGCTGKGNDQVRFELTYATLAPDLPVIAPWREWSIRSREDALAYAEQHGVPVVATKEKIYSRDRNLWHLSHEGGILENPDEAPPDDLFQLTANAVAAPDTAEDVRITFEKGTPAAVNGHALDAVSLVATLNNIGGRHGVGRIDLVEDRMVGMKSRGVYETPGGTLLYAAHSELEQLVLDRKTLAAKDLVAPRYADLVYEGRWWTTEREAYDAFVSVTQERVTGSVTLRLFKGTVTVVGRSSEHALYDERFVTFGEDDVYQQSDAAGYIRLFALPSRVRALKDMEMGVAGNGYAGVGKVELNSRAGGGPGPSSASAPPSPSGPSSGRRPSGRSSSSSADPSAPSSSSATSEPAHAPRAEEPSEEAARAALALR